MSSAPTEIDELEQAKRNAAMARARVQTSVGALKQRLNPRNIAADAIVSVKEQAAAIGERASDVAKRRPVATSAAAGVATVIILRKPVTRLLKRLFGRSSDEDRQIRQDRRLAKRAAKAAAKQEKARATGQDLVAAPNQDPIPQAANVNTAAPAKQE